MFPAAMPAKVLRSDIGLLFEGGGYVFPNFCRSTKNPRYFCGESGSPVLLIGHICILPGGAGNCVQHYKCILVMISQGFGHDFRMPRKLRLYFTSNYDLLTHAIK